jgi:hypothetical protein
MRLTDNCQYTYNRLIIIYNLLINITKKNNDSVKYQGQL